MYETFLLLITDPGWKKKKKKKVRLTMTGGGIRGVHALVVVASGGSAMSLRVPGGQSSMVVGEEAVHVLDDGGGHLPVDALDPETVLPDLAVQHSGSALVRVYDPRGHALTPQPGATRLVEVQPRRFVPSVRVHPIRSGHIHCLFNPSFFRALSEIREEWSSEKAIDSSAAKNGPTNHVTNTQCV